MHTRSTTSVMSTNKLSDKYRLHNPMHTADIAVKVDLAIKTCNINGSNPCPGKSHVLIRRFKISAHHHKAFHILITFLTASWRTASLHSLPQYRYTATKSMLRRRHRCIYPFSDSLQSGHRAKWALLGSLKLKHRLVTHGISYLITGRKRKPCVSKI